VVLVQIRARAFLEHRGEGGDDGEERCGGGEGGGGGGDGARLMWLEMDSEYKYRPYTRRGVPENDWRDADTCPRLAQL